MKKRALLCFLILLSALGAVLFVACDKPVPQPPPAPQADPCESGHRYGEPTVLTSPTCTETGSEQMVCTVCGAEKLSTLEALGHKEGTEWVIDTPATCEADGARHKECTVCGEVLEVAEIDAVGHTEVKDDAVAATCTSTGLTEGKHCSVCDKILVAQSVVEKLAHTKVEHEAKSATCTAIGWNAYVTCSRCDYTTYEEIPAKGHNHTAVVTPPTCLEKGYTTHTCHCKDTYVDTYVDAIGHDEVSHEAKSATCTAIGWNAYVTCSRCDYSTYEEIPATGHNHTAVVTPPTCLEKGYTTHTCHCKDTYVDTYVDALGHDEASHEAKNVTCTAIGWNAYVTCSRCDYTTYEEIPATGHNHTAVVTPPTCLEKGYTTHTCHCKDTYVDTYVDALGHDEASHEAKSATCTAIGWNAYVTCSRCDYTTYEEIPAKGHSASGWIIDKAATCTSVGRKHTACTVCKITLKTAEISMLDHTEVKDAAVAATCTSTGLTEGKHCSVCGKVLLAQSVTEKTAHTSGKWIIDVAPGCEGEGSKHQECTACKKVLKSESIVATGHSATAWQEVLKDGAATDRMEKRCRTCGVVLESGKKEEIVQTSGAQTTVSLSDYRRIVYPASASDAFIARVNAFAAQLYQLTGNTIVAVPDTAVPEVREILIGRVNRTEANTALSDITGQGYTVQYQNGKIVITGSTNLTALMGLAYFESTYMQGESARITLYQKAFSDRYLTVTVASGKEIYYTPVYKDGLDTDGTYHGNSDPETEYDPVNLGTARDYPYDATLLIRDALLAITGADKLSLLTDKTAKSGFEIQIGMLDRDTVRAVLSMLEGGDLAIVVRGGALVVTAYSEAALRVAAPLAAGYLADACYTDENGVTSILFPVNFSYVQKANEHWFTDFEKPDGLTLTSSEDMGDSTLQYYYEGASRQHFDAYVAKLLAAGYRVVTQSEADGNAFATLLSPTGKETLHISFHAYLYAEGSNYSAAKPSLRVSGAKINSVYAYFPMPSASYKLSYPAGDTALYIFYNKEGESKVSKTFFETTFKNQLLKSSNGYKLVVESTQGEKLYYLVYNPDTDAYIYVLYHTEGTFSYRENGETVLLSGEHVAAYYYARGVINLPTADILSPSQNYEKKTDSAITSVGLTDVGTGYIITLEDGRFVILDGGTARSYTPERLWAILCDLHTQIWGQAPSEEKPIEIAAWVISHAHGDHMNAFWDFANFYGGGNGGKSKTGGKALVRVAYLLANTPGIATTYNTGGAAMTLRDEMRKINKYFKHGFTFIRVHTGQKLYFANLEIEFMFTHEDLYPCRVVTFNDTSMMTRLRFTPTNDAGAKGTPVTFLFTGDAYLNGGRWMCASYGEYMKSDMVTLSHHGGPGVEKRFYEKVAPRVLWWPHKTSSVYGTYLVGSSKDKQYFYYEVDQYAFYNLSSVDYVYIADEKNITLYLRYGGADYDNLYITEFVVEKDGDTVTNVTVEKVTISYHSLSRNPGWLDKLGLRSKKPIIIKKKG